MAHHKLAVFMLANVLAACVSANEEADGFTKRIELPAHVQLEALRSAPDVELAAFTTDGCSGWQSQAWSFVAENILAFKRAHQNLPPWEACCVIHDRAYHSGGTEPLAEVSFEARLEADEALRTCVVDTSSNRKQQLSELYGVSQAQVSAAYRTISEAMLAAVRLGGAPCTGLPWRWGYGYPDC